MASVYYLKLDKEALDDYTKAYFKVYPRRKKIPITQPFVPSLNIYLNLTKEARNNLKERWEEFVYHSCENQGLLGLNITRCKVDIHFVFGNKRKSDLDNYCPKMIFDGMSRANVWADDNRFIVNAINFSWSYEKGNPHMIIRIEELEDEK